MAEWFTPVLSVPKLSWPRLDFHQTSVTREHQNITGKVLCPSLGTGGCVTILGTGKEHFMTPESKTDTEGASPTDPVI